VTCGFALAGTVPDDGKSPSPKEAAPMADTGDEKEQPGLVDKAKDVAEDLADKAKPALDKAGEVAGDLADKAKPALDKAGEVASDLFGKAKGFFKKDDTSSGGTDDDTE
jgi:hypothetical protein